MNHKSMKSKNDIKERRGTILFIIIILSPFIIYGSVQAWAYYELSQIKFSNNHSDSETVNQSKTTDPFYNTDWPQFLKPKTYSLFVGGDMESEIKISQGIEFTAIDSSTIEYQIDFLEDWKTKHTIKGKAQLDYESLDNDLYKITNNAEETFPAYRFTGKYHNCKIELLISKTETRASSFAKIYLHCPGKTEEYKTIMYFK